MSPFVFLLVCGSSFLHVFWNTLFKKCTDKASFLLLTTAISTVGLLAVFILLRMQSPVPLSFGFWKLAALSGFFQALYMIFLISAYHRTDLSVAYPLSRGIAPLITLAVGGSLVGDWVSPENAFAVAVIAVGVGSVCISSARSGCSEVINLAGSAFAVATGCMIAGYHLVDRTAMSVPAPLSPLEYLFMCYVFLLSFVSLWVCVGLKRWKLVRTEWKANRSAALAVGFFTPLSYSLIVLALKYGNVTYVTASRNLGILISLGVSALFLKERVTAARIAGASLIAGGLVLLLVLNSH
jgi:drug/metabolite transporter (DMT)-like permease